MYIICNDDYSEQGMRTNVHCSVMGKTARSIKKERGRETEKVDRKKVNSYYDNKNWMQDE